VRAASDGVSTGALRQSSAGHWLTGGTHRRSARGPQAAGCRQPAHTGSRLCAASVHIGSGVGPPADRASARRVHRAPAALRVGGSLSTGGPDEPCKIPCLFTGRAPAAAAAATTNQIALYALPAMRVMTQDAAAPARA
jgi:hypothetical protein